MLGGSEVPRHPDDSLPGNIGIHNIWQCSGMTACWGVNTQYWDRTQGLPHSKHLKCRNLSRVSTHTSHSWLVRNMSLFHYLKKKRDKHFSRQRETLDSGEEVLLNFHLFYQLKEVISMQADKVSTTLLIGLNCCGYSYIAGYYRCHHLRKWVKFPVTRWSKWIPRMLD